MGGRGSSKDYPPFGGVGGSVGNMQGSPCDNISEEVIVANIDLSVLTTVKVGDVLGVEVTSPSGNQELIVVTGKAILGKIWPSSIKSILRCISDGRRFSATIVAKNRTGAKIRLEAE